MFYYITLLLSTQHAFSWIVLLTLRLLQLLLLLLVALSRSHTVHACACYTEHVHCMKTTIVLIPLPGRSWQ